MTRFALLAALLLAFTTPALAADSLTAAQKAEVETIVKDIIGKSGGEIMAAVQTHQMESQRKAEEEASKALKDKTKELFENPDVPFIGPKDADVKIVQFFDYNCGYCKKALPVVSSISGSDKNVQFLFFELPILSPASREAAQYAIAANKQGKYWEFHQALMNFQGQKDAALFEKIAKDIGADFTKMKSDAASEDTTRILADKQKLAQELGISGTPAFIVNDQIIRGYLEEGAMKDRIAAARAAKKS